jgi:serine/threonine-protein kinase
MNTLEIVPDEHDAALGTLLCGRYRIDALLGRGAMGAVYRAWDTQRQAACAIKLLRVDSEVRDAASRRFVDEGRLVRQIFHPNIVEVFDQGLCEDGTLFLVMELLSGQDLDAYLCENPRLSLQQTQDIVYQVGSALHAVHQIGIVHRDIKPRNIFLLSHPTGNGIWEPPRIKVIDFGLAKYLEERHVSRGSDGMLIGTPEYLAPEAWTGVSEQVDTRVDQWALAVLAFRLLSGRLPFEGQLDTLRLGREIVSGTPHSLRELVPDVPDYVERAVSRALAKSKEDRFASIRDFVCAFTHRPLHASMLFSGSTAIRPAPVEPAGPAETCRIAVERPSDDPLDSTLAMTPDEHQPLIFSPASVPEASSDLVAESTAVVGAVLASDPLATCMLGTAPEPQARRSQPTPARRVRIPAWALHTAQALLTLSVGGYLLLAMQPATSPQASPASAAAPPADEAGSPRQSAPVRHIPRQRVAPENPPLSPRPASEPATPTPPMAAVKARSQGAGHGHKPDGGPRTAPLTWGADKPSKRRTSPSLVRNVEPMDPLTTGSGIEIRPWSGKRGAAPRPPDELD